MAKRFTDTDKYKKAFIRSLPGAYKLFWDYLYHDCDHAGIWHKDFDVAQIRIGKDMKITETEALEMFNANEERVRPLRGGDKWFLMPFIEFQYGTLNPANRLHSSVISILDQHGIRNLIKVLGRTLQAPTEGAKDKDKDKDKEMSLVVVSKKEEALIPEVVSKAPKKPPTEIQVLVEGWKLLIGVPKEESKDWNKVHFARAAKSAESLLILYRDVNTALDCMEHVYNHMRAKNLDCTIETVVKRSDLFNERQGARTVR